MSYYFSEVSDTKTVFKHLRDFRDFKEVSSDLRGNFKIFMVVSNSKRSFLLKIP